MVDATGTIEIIGGGLAGLSLGLALRQAHVPVILREAGVYPRHRVCGEFIAGLDETTSERLGLKPFLEDAQRLKTVVWIARGRPMRTQTLPQSALGISRFRLDARLAQAFTEAGGNLLTHSTAPATAAPGRVLATGRKITRSEWIGLKIHARNLTPYADLEVHLGDHAYVGLSSVEDGIVNLCGLFRRRDLSPPSKEKPRSEFIFSYLEAAGLRDLTARMRQAQLDETSFHAVTHLGYRKMPRLNQEGDSLAIGDAFALIPPFTGNGMAMAFQSAALAVDPLVQYARGEIDWEDVRLKIDQAAQELFRRRIAAANLLHPFLHRPSHQRWLFAASRLHALPIDSLYRITH